MDDSVSWPFREKIMIRRVARDINNPHGIKYSLVLIDLRTNKRIICFDNHHGKGYHFHRLKKEFAYQYHDEWQLITDFLEEVKQMKRRLLQ